MAHGDLDGDTYTDLVLSYRRGSGPSAQRYLAVFFRSAEGYPARPQVAFRAPPTAAAFDVGDALGDGRDEVLYLTSTGVFVQTFEARKPGRPQRLISTATLVSGPEEEDLATWDFLRTLPGGKSVLMVPGRRRLRVYTRGPEKWAIWADVQVDLHSYYDAESKTYRRSGRGGATGRPYAFRVTTIVPNVEWVDQTGDGRLDLVTFYEDRVAVHVQDDSGALAPKPTHRRWFRVRSKAELESRDTRVSAKVRDLDGDGIADLALGKIGGGITTLKTELRLYKGVKGGGFGDTPAQVFADEGFAALSDFVDVDGDGTLEMVHPLSEVSIVAMSRAMLSKTLDLDVRIRERSPAHAFFHPKPVQTLETSYGLDLSVGASIRGAAPLFGRDFDGDGRPDVLLSEGGEAMVVHSGRGGPTARFAEDGHVRLEAPGTNHTLPVPVRQGAAGPLDIVQFYVARRSLAGRIFVFTRQ